MKFDVLIEVENGGCKLTTLAADGIGYFIQNLTPEAAVKLKEMFIRVYRQGRMSMAADVTNAIAHVL